MVSDYDAIGDHYQQVKDLPITIGSELPTLSSLMGDLSGLNVLDLACGHGFYTRYARKLGARRAIGIDISAAMLDAARRDEKLNPLGIEYVHADAASVRPAELAQPNGFELVLAIFLLNYANDPGMLERYFQSVIRCLQPGGRMIAVLPNPSFRFSALETQHYSFQCLKIDANSEGTKFQVKILGSSPITLESWQWSQSTVNKALVTAGMTGITWHPLRVSDEAQSKYGQMFWENYLLNPPNIALTAERKA